jgi:predicted RNase H-like nuclease
MIFITFTFCMQTEKTRQTELLGRKVKDQRSSSICSLSPRTNIMYGDLYEAHMDVESRLTYNRNDVGQVFTFSGFTLSN